MKTTGIVRRIDDLGRVIISRSLRQQFGIKEGDPLEFFTDGNKIIIQKYSTFESRAQLAAEFVVRNQPAHETFFQLYGRTTICTIVRDGQRPQIGAAQCNMSDQFSHNIGKAIALARALGREVPSQLLD